MVGRAYGQNTQPEKEKRTQLNVFGTLCVLLRQLVIVAETSIRTEHRGSGGGEFGGGSETGFGKAQHEVRRPSWTDHRHYFASCFFSLSMVSQQFARSRSDEDSRASRSSQCGFLPVNKLISMQAMIAQ